ncbi:hypothetical protein DC28_05230 [Spirochaeta lutea]|uniref:Uncharacterized protein n=2 Tax=Spirochaeta lutea TaxID=1480694 RepID=A0A098R373_9SPIO|nr:hypothetical protein DC28_05230 [Spirochaeta lutea]
MGSSLLLFSQTGSVDNTPIGQKTQVESEINWQTGTLTLFVSSTLQPETVNPASAVTILSQRMANNRIAFVLQAMMEIRVNSSTRIREIAKENPQLLRDIEALAAESTIQPYILSPDLQRVTLPITVNLFPKLSDLLVNHRVPTSLPRVFTTQVPASHTGLVIFAGEPLAVHGEFLRGEQRYSEILPAMFLDLYDEDLTALLKPNQMDPGYLTRWGAAAYTSDFDEDQFRDRIGANPLRVSATALFGINDTDIIIPNRSASVLLSNPENHRILTQGRILIIIPEHRLIESLP